MAQISKYKNLLPLTLVVGFLYYLFLVSGFLVDFLDNALFNEFPLLSYSVSNVPGFS